MFYGRRDWCSMKTLKNKIGAIGLIGAGLVPVIFDGDASFLVFASFIAIPMLMSKENVFYD